jgi:gamma-glutamyltranspeptidase/glutathione hydrolase
MRRLILLIFMLQSLLVTAPVGAQGIIGYSEIHHPVYGRNGMVAAQNLIAADIGAEVLADGGNAVDAAVAVGFALARQYWWWRFHARL